MKIRRSVSVNDRTEQIEIKGANLLDAIQAAESMVHKHELENDRSADISIHSHGIDWSITVNWVELEEEMDNETAGVIGHEQL